MLFLYLKPIIIGVEEEKRREEKRREEKRREEKRREEKVCILYKGHLVKRRVLECIVPGVNMFSRR
ncbi:MAG: hypothetical protein HS132_02580 [Planctomycetia bacterium]|nr:hypothetical protein [Planctomycetia bacterium]